MDAMVKAQAFILPASIGFVVYEYGVGASFTGVIFFAIAIALFVSLVALPLYGMPIYFILKKIGLCNLPLVLVAGALPGIVWYIYGDKEWGGAAIYYGTVISGAFWYVARKADQISNSNNRLHVDSLDARE